MWERALRYLTGAEDEGGFTLIEVLISMAITVIVMGAVFGLLTRGQQTFQREPEVVDLQQSARSALDMVARDVLQAGAGLPPEFPAFTTKAIDATVGDQTPTDVIEIVGALQTPGDLPSDPEEVFDFDGTTVTLDSDTTQLKSGDLVVLYTYDQASNYAAWVTAWVDSVPPGAPATVVLDTTNTLPGYTMIPGAPVVVNWANGRIVRVKVVRYETDVLPSNEAANFSVPPRVLKRQVDFGAKMPIGYLEDFQISYWVGNVTPVEQQDAPNPQPTPGVAIQEVDLISTVKITVTARSASENLQGAEAGAAGNFIRRTYSSNVNPRNISAGLAARTAFSAGGIQYQ